MFYIYVKFAAYLFIALTSTRFASGYFARLGSSRNKQKLILPILLLSFLSLACFYLAINNAAHFIYPHLRM